VALQKRVASLTDNFGTRKLSSETGSFKIRMLFPRKDREFGSFSPIGDLSLNRKGIGELNTYNWDILLYTGTHKAELSPDTDRR
jgi:hypothetical protein